MRTNPALAIGLALWLASPMASAVTCLGGTASNPDGIYMDNGDGTVTDTHSGLVWDKCAWGRSGGDCAGGAVATMNWSDALSIAVAANSADYKGHHDWRLPNIKELDSLVETCRTAPAINDALFPNTPPEYFWSSSPSHNAVYAQTMYFDYGTIGSDYRDAPYAVRLVRSAQAAPPPAVGDVQPIPVLDPLGLAALSSLLGLIGTASRRRRR